MLVYKFTQASQNHTDSGVVLGGFCCCCSGKLCFHAYYLQLCVTVQKKMSGLFSRGKWWFEGCAGMHSDCQLPEEGFDWFIIRGLLCLEQPLQVSKCFCNHWALVWKRSCRGVEKNAPQPDAAGLGSFNWLLFSMWELAVLQLSCPTQQVYVLLESVLDQNVFSVRSSLVFGL